MLRQKLFQFMEQFFQLPTASKQQLSRSDANFWGFYDKELTKNEQDWKEIYDIDANINSLQDPNCAMPVHWPDELPGLKQTAIDWMQVCESLCNDLNSAISLSLGQSQNRLKTDFVENHSSFLRFNYYPLCPKITPDQSRNSNQPLGINRHTDAGALTLLAQDEVPALQIRKDNTWLSVIPEPDAFIVNIGDMIQVWSNDRFHAAEHRVIASSERVRYSAPYFYNPSYDSVISPLVDQETPAIYRPIPWSEYRNGRAAGDYTDHGEEIQIAWYRK
jgi:isopenicillin N synthase-like dioxygenase